jgi:hypothetical protein
VEISASQAKNKRPVRRAFELQQRTIVHFFTHRKLNAQETHIELLLVYGLNALVLATVYSSTSVSLMAQPRSAMILGQGDYRRDEIAVLHEIAARQISDTAKNSILLETLLIKQNILNRDSM